MMVYMCLFIIFVLLFHLPAYTVSTGYYRNRQIEFQGNKFTFRISCVIAQHEYNKNGSFQCASFLSYFARERSLMAPDKES